jgi:hypothetical protein
MFLRTGERSVALDSERPPEPRPNPVCLHKEAFAAQYYAQTPVSSSPTCILAPSLCRTGRSQNAEFGGDGAMPSTS